MIDPDRVLRIRWRALRRLRSLWASRLRSGGAEAVGLAWRVRRLERLLADRERRLTAAGIEFPAVLSVRTETEKQIET